MLSYLKDEMYFNFLGCVYRELLCYFVSFIFLGIYTSIWPRYCCLSASKFFVIQFKLHCAIFILPKTQTKK